MSGALATNQIESKSSQSTQSVASGDSRNLATANTSRAATARLNSLVGSNSLVPVIFIVAAFLAVAIAAVLWATGPTYQVLYSNLSDSDGGAIISELEQRQIPYRFTEGGTALMVPSDVVHTLRLQLAEQGLPKGGKVGFELLDNQAFGTSQFAEQVNYQRGLEGELARSMESLGPVAQARVHLAMAKPSVFVNQRQPAKASVILNLQPGRTLTESQVNAITHMVSSSVPDLSTDNVSVVDQRGELLSRAGNQLSGLDGTQLAYTKQVEQAYQERVNNILTPILGNENYRVQVTAEIDFSAVEQTSEAYSPNQTPETSAIRSSQSRTNFSGDDATARGIPGALSNTAPNWAPSPIDAETDAEDPEGTAPDPSAQASLQRDNVVNYEVDRSITHTKRPVGETRRLSVAVVVNNREGLDEEGNSAQLALPQNELDQITRLVRQAVGFSEVRGDQVEVINSPFSEIVEVPVEETPWWQSQQAIDSGKSVGRYLLTGFLLLLGYRKIISPVLKKHIPANTQGQLNGPKGADTLALASGTAEGAEAGEATNQNAPFKRVDKTNSYIEQLNELKKISTEDPKMIAMIVRNWMRADD